MFPYLVGSLSSSPRDPNLSSSSRFLDDIICEPEPKFTAQSGGHARKPEISYRRRDEVFASIRRSCLSRCAAAPPTSIAINAKASSTSDTDSVHISASSVALGPHDQSLDDGVNVFTEAVNHQQPKSNGTRSKLQNSSPAEDSRHDALNERTTSSAKTGKLRLSRPTAARRATAPPPTEMIHEDVFPPPDQRNAREQTLIDQLRRNGQLVEHNREVTLAEQHSDSQSALLSSHRFSSHSAHGSSSLHSTLVRNQCLALPWFGYTGSASPGSKPGGFSADLELD